MKNIDCEEELLNINGGASLTSSFLNAISNCIDSLLELGRSLGSALRRSMSGRMC